MSDKLITLKQVTKIWEKSQEDNTKAIEYLKKERGIEVVQSPVGYIENHRIDSSFFLKDVLVFPLFGADGKIKGVNTRKSYDKFFIRILCSSYPLIYSNYEFFDKTHVVVESPICALTLRPFLPGIEVSASLSASMTEQTITLLSTSKSIISLLDNDEAGQRGAKKLEESCSNAFVIPAHMYEGLKDPNDLYLKDRESFDILVEYIKSIDRRMRKRA